MDCGCKIDLNFIDKLQGQGLEFSIIYCPMHKAAPDLVAALEAFVEAWEKSHQLEKTDVAFRMAQHALAKAGKD